jgi:gliding motility-associated-like protein
MSGGPIAAVTGNPATIVAGSSTTLSASGGITYSWSNGATGSVITVTPSATAQYCVYVFDSAGCSDSACVIIYMELPCGEFYIPNAFSPNGDGENDDFRIYAGNVSCVKDFKLIIYNRWGEKVFETVNAAEGWNGMHRGKLSNSAVYSYYCTATLANGTVIEKKGNVSLVK